MDIDRRLFFAIPFDSATLRLYERVRDKIRRKYPRMTVEIGSAEVGPSPEYSDIASFKAQNRELNQQFVAKILEADIVVADLTHNNPNVHVELGIALQSNKNVLRVTGRSLTELGFDIRNFEAYPYTNQEALTKKILDYCECFLKIKALPISNDSGPLYSAETCPINLAAPVNRADIKQVSPAWMRDGAIRVRFELTRTGDTSDWFGVFFRAGANPFVGSHLLYVRGDGKIELGRYPGPEILSVHEGKPQNGVQKLTLEFENNHLHVRLGKSDFFIHKLYHQAAGGVWLATYDADATISSLEMVCRDTVEWGGLSESGN
jgi:hypothetical protein